MVEYHVGDRVLIQPDKLGTVRFIGFTEFETGELVGVELDEATGEHNGTVEGVSYFSCTSNHGIFVRADTIRPHDQGVAAALVLQSQVRKLLAIKKVSAIQASRTWNVLDAHNEDLGIRRGKAIEQATKELRKRAVADDLPPEVQLENLTVEELHRLASESVANLTEEALMAIPVEEGYSGPHLSFPLTLRDVLQMLDDFKQHRQLHAKYLMLLFFKCRAILNEEKTLQEITVTDDVELTVVGDLHGQLQDLFTIFKINQVPSKDKWYLFNGDFVDRGPKGCEILASICAFKVLYPHCVFMNRGNHEARAQNAWMGFEEEVLTKYCGAPDNLCVPSNDRIASLKLYMLCQSMFDALPLCALIQERIFVCHGGLFRNDGVQLDHLRNIMRKREPPLEGRSLEDRVYEDLLWSDPRPTSQYARSLDMRRPSDRGAGCEFGPLVTNAFCSLNQVALVVRSHECVPEGFELLHNGRLITIFSASRYCGTQTNKGAFITFNKAMQPEIQQFYANAIDQSGSFVTEVERQAKLEEDAIHMIIEHLIDKRLDLFWYFTQADTGHTGLVSRVEWASAMQNVLNLDVPFLHYQTQLAECDPQGRINYSLFLSRFQVQMREEDMGWQDAVIRRVCEKLYCQFGTDLAGAYRKFDANDDGYIEYQEFVKTLKGLDVGLSEQQLYELMRSVDVNDDAHIDFQEFCERFEVVFKSIHQYDVEKSQGARGRTRGLSLEEIKKKSEMEEAASVDGTLVESSIANNKLPAVDEESEGHHIRLNWNALDEWTLNGIVKIGKAIYKSEKSLEEAFEQFDKSNTKNITPDSFAEALKEFGLDFTVDECKKLYVAVDANDSGSINYLEFVEAFQISDKDPRSATWKQGVVQQVSNTLYQHRIHLSAAFRLFDPNNSGWVSAEAFSEGMKAVNKLLQNPLSAMQIEELRNALDRNGDGRIDYKEFFEGLAIEDTHQQVDASGGPVHPRRGLFRRSSSYMSEGSKSLHVPSESQQSSPPDEQPPAVRSS